jgi:nucleolar pre-ribosomal-associated protein 2
MDYLRELVQAFVQGSSTDGQASAIHTVVDQLLGKLTEILPSSVD